VSADFLGYGGAFAVLGGVWLVSLAPVFFVGTSRPRAGRSGHGEPISAKRVLRILTDPGVANMVLGGFYLSMMLTFFSTFIPLLALGRDLSLSQVGLMRGAYTFTNAVARPLTGPWVGRVSYRRAQLGGFAFEAGMLTLFFVPFGFGAYLLLSVGAGLGRSVAMVANTLVMAMEIDPSRLSRGMTAGLSNASRDLGNILGPVLAGLIAQVVGIYTFWLIAPPLWIVSYLVLLALVRRYARHPQPA
jgi:MFS family permease